MKKGWLIGIGITVAIAVAGWFTYEAIPRVSVVEPTCENSGYTIRTQFGRTQFLDITEAVGHKFSDWTSLSENRRSRTCSVCNEVETETLVPETTIPQLFLTGSLEGISKTAQVGLEAKLKGAEVAFEGYALLKNQGHTSLQYDKRNFTLKLFSDIKYDEKAKLTFSHWQPEHKYILKADYVDTSRSRNLIGEDLWSQMVATRTKLPQRLKDSSNYGATDGFPVAVYLNDEFLGLYNFTLHKDDDLFLMEDGRKDGIMIINETRTQAAFFREEIAWLHYPDWEVEYCGEENDWWIKDKTDRFLEFVQTATDAEFRQNLAKYADVESLIDYLIAVYALGVPDNSARDLILATYDNGVFFASMFDMEGAFGLKRDGSGFYAADFGLPVMKDGKLTSGTESLLWDRLIANFFPELCSRYAKLRQDTLSLINVEALAKEKIGAIPADLNRADMTLYPDQPGQTTDHLQQIKTYTQERFTLLDKIFAEEKE